MFKNLVLSTTAASTNHRLCAPQGKKLITLFICIILHVCNLSICIAVTTIHQQNISKLVLVVLLTTITTILVVVVVAAMELKPCPQYYWFLASVEIGIVAFSATARNEIFFRALFCIEEKQCKQRWCFIENLVVLVNC